MRTTAYRRYACTTSAIRPRACCSPRVVPWILFRNDLDTVLSQLLPILMLTCLMNRNGRWPRQCRKSSQRPPSHRRNGHRRLAYKC